MRILHLAVDDKFIDHGYFLFEKAYPKRNDVYIFSKSSALKFVKIEYKKIIRISNSRVAMPKVSEACYQLYDLIVFHSFNEILYPEIFNIPNDIPSVWLGWGFDYYDLICKPENLLLPETKRLAAKVYRSRVRKILGRALRFIYRAMKMSKSKKQAIERLTIFAPVLPHEHQMVRKSHQWHRFPDSACWNYGTMENDLLKGFDDEHIDGNAILVGNSASLTCNHMETLSFLYRAGLSDRNIIVPLSYGDRNYGERIDMVGRRLFNDNFNSLKEFMPIKKYVSTIKKCRYVIMNHKRQQALGNIVIMLYLGARVFLREENPIYAFLKEMGVVLSTVQEMESELSLLETPLSTEERERNKRLVSDYWSQERAVCRTKSIVEQALNLSVKTNEVGRGLVI